MACRPFKVNVQCRAPGADTSPCSGSGPRDVERAGTRRWRCTTRGEGTARSGRTAPAARSSRAFGSQPSRCVHPACTCLFTCASEASAMTILALVVAVWSALALLVLMVFMTLCRAAQHQDGATARPQPADHRHSRPSLPVRSGGPAASRPGPAVLWQPTRGESLLVSAALGRRSRLHEGRFRAAGPVGRPAAAALRTPDGWGDNRLT